MNSGEARNEKKGIKALGAPDLEKFLKFFKNAEVLSSEIQSSKVSFDMLMLLFWVKQKEPTSLKDISIDLSFNPAKTTRSIEILIQYRFVNESLNLNDMRSSFLRLSPRGTRLISELEKKVGKKEAYETLDFFVDFRRALNYCNLHYEENRITEGKARLLTIAFFLDCPTTVSELCQKAKLKQPSVSMMLQSLVNKGFFAREKKAEGICSREVALSEEGKKASKLLLDGFRQRA